MLPGLTGNGFYGSAPPPLAFDGFSTGSGTGSKDYTIAALGSVTPKAAFLVGTNQLVSSEPNEQADTSFTFGVITAAGQAACFSFSQDDLANTNCKSNSRTDRALLIHDDNTASGALIAGGINLDFGVNNNDKRFTAAFFVGEDITATSGTIALGTGTSPIAVNTGFEPDVVILFGEHGTFDNTPVTTGMKYQFGVAANDGSATQRCVVCSEEDGQAAGEPYQSLLTDCALGLNSQTTGAIAAKGVVGGYSGSGFTLTPTASLQSRVAAYLALNFGGRAFKLMSFDTPTTTGNHSITGVGFRPSFALAVVTNLEAVDTSGATSDLQSGFGIGFISDYYAWSNAWRIDSGADPTDTASQTSNVALMGPSATDCDAIRASFVSFNADGMTLNYSATQGNAKKGFVLFVA